jgi:hypothetical protein
MGPAEALQIRGVEVPLRSLPDGDDMIDHRRLLAADPAVRMFPQEDRS